MPRLPMLLPVLLLSPLSAAAEPVGWQECTGLADNPSIWPDCAQSVSAECVATRASDGDVAWASCLKIRAEEWEAALVDQSTGLRDRNHPAGEGAALSRWMASRAARCHRQSEITRMTEQFGQTAAAAAVFQCELASNIEETMRLQAISARE